MIRFKSEVRIGYFSAHSLGQILECASVWSFKARVDVEINSINDGVGVHMLGSLHGLDLAMDLDTVGDKPADTQALAEYLRRWLPPDYDVLFEANHVHVEYDPHRGPLKAVVANKGPGV